MLTTKVDVGRAMAVVSYMSGAMDEVMLVSGGRAYSLPC